jgi:hypothetical protein
MYGSNFSFISPGKTLSSPCFYRRTRQYDAFNLFSFKALTAIATPVYVFPVPAGPTVPYHFFHGIDQ